MGDEVLDHLILNFEAIWLRMGAWSLRYPRLSSVVYPGYHMAVSCLVPRHLMLIQSHLSDGATALNYMDCSMPNYLVRQQRYFSIAINSTSTQHDAWAGARIQQNEALVTLLCRASHGAITIQDSKDQFVMRALVPSCSLDLPLVALNVQNLNPGPCADTTQTCAPQFEASAVPTSITSIPLSLHKKVWPPHFCFSNFTRLPPLILEELHYVDATGIGSLRPRLHRRASRNCTLQEGCCTRAFSMPQVHPVQVLGSVLFLIHPVWVAKRVLAYVQEESKRVPDRSVQHSLTDHTCDKQVTSWRPISHSQKAEKVWNEKQCHSSSFHPEVWRAW